MTEKFHGVKVALFNHDKILIYLRDNKPGLRFAGLWDLPGGGREGNETPEETAIREIQEEFGITLAVDQLHYTKIYPSMHLASSSAVFIVGDITDEQVTLIQFGSEGQRYEIVPIADYLAIEDAVKPLQERVRDYFENLTGVTS